ncbi:MAG: DHHA1 domain-containing protein [Nanoarchaeota archaeon]|nr:DHHA1 domain-containing protein [Nanoarchaeota archaeon]
MLTEKQNQEIRELLDASQNPLFYFDNDQDGLCSYLILRRVLGRGNGVPVKTSPLDDSYFFRINEFEPDAIFILDQPTVSKEFFESIRERNIPVTWIDHHTTPKEDIPEWINYYNCLDNGENVPVVKMCYDLYKRKEDLWLLIVGGIADKYFPEEYEKFSKEFPELIIDSKEPFEIFYNSDIGKISRMIGVGLKDRTTLVMKMIRFLIEAKTPLDVLDENSKNKEMHERFSKINLKLNNFVEKAKKEAGKKVLFFKYAGETSMSADLSNKLSYEVKDKVIVVAYVKGARVNVSMRGKKIRDKVLEILKEFPLSTGGGHEDAVGAQMDLDQLDEFVEKLEKSLE